MKIVHIEDYFDPTAGYQINELLNASKNSNIKTYLITSDCMKPFHKDLDKSKDIEFERKTGVKIIRLESKMVIASRVLMKGLYSTVDKIRPDIVFAHGIGDFKDLLLWRNTKYNIIRDCHMSWIASQNKFRKLYYKMFKLFFANKINKTDKYKKIYALGEEEYEYLKALGINDDKIDYLYHGYNDETMYYDEAGRNEIRNKYSIRKDEILISYIGKFDEHKRPDIIFDIVNELEKSYVYDKNIKLLFIGSKDKNYMIEFNKKMKNSNIEDKIILDDAKSFTELRKYFSASEICIFPKACTLSSIHAQVCRSYVIMEDHKSNRERVVNKSHLYNIDDISKASEILKSIINNINCGKSNICIGKLEYREYKSQNRKLIEAIKNNFQFGAIK